MSVGLKRSVIKYIVAIYIGFLIYNVNKSLCREVYMATSSITDCFVLDDKGVDRLIEIIENSKAHPDKKIYESHKY